MLLRRWEWPARRPIAGGAGSWLRASPGCRTVPAVHDAALGGHRVRWSGASSVSTGARSFGPVRIGYRLGLAASTVYRVLCRLGLQRLSWLDRPTGRVIRRYEHPHPGDLLHMDIKKLGRIPPGGGWRAHGRGRAGARQRVGYAYIHSAVDDHSRLAYSEVLADERAVTVVAFWRRALAWFADRGVTAQAVLTDNGSAYRSADFARACLAAGIRHRRTRPYRPQTNGKVERFNRTLLEEWAYVRVYRSEQARTAALARWLHHYNHHRGHTALGGLPPVSRVTNLPGQYT